MLLYRGVSKKFYLESDGEILPKGHKAEVAAKHDRRIKYDGRFTFGKSKENAVNAHHIETGLYDGGYISTTTIEANAIHFATRNYSETGIIYVLDSNLFEKHNIESIESRKPLYPDEAEVSIRSTNGRNIPKDVVVEEYEVNSKGIRV